MIKGTFQDPVTPVMYGISALHDHILFFLAVILFVVVYIFVTTLILFLYDDSEVVEEFVDSDASRYDFPRSMYVYCRVVNGRFFEAYKNHKFSYQWAKLNNGTYIEIVWTIIPSIILLLIAIPSFALLFAIDEITLGKLLVKVIGHQ